MNHERVMNQTKKRNTRLGNPVWNTRLLTHDHHATQPSPISSRACAKLSCMERGNRPEIRNTLLSAAIESIGPAPLPLFRCLISALELSLSRKWIWGFAVRAVLGIWDSSLSSLSPSYPLGLPVVGCECFSSRLGKCNWGTPGSEITLFCGFVRPSDRGGKLAKH